MGKPKHGYEKVKEFFEKKGYTLISPIYESSKKHLQARCINGHSCFITYNDLSQGHGCSDCYGNKKKTIEYVQKIFSEQGYTLLSNKYINSITPLHVRCPQGHDGYPTYGNFQQGERCLDCSGNKKKEYEEVKELFEKEGYKLISAEYKKNKEILDTLCPVGHEYRVSFIKFKDGDRCTDCSGLKKKTIEQARQLFEKDGYTLISTIYIDNHEPLKTICPKGHDYLASYANFQTGYRCSSCSKSGTSDPEIELFNFLKEYFPNLIKKFFPVKINGKPYIHRFQVDILDPETKLGIEYDGPYHHSEEYLIKSKTELGWPIEDAINYHLIKDQALWDCHGIKLLHIKGKDWENDKQVCIDKCLNFLGIKNE